MAHTSAHRCRSYGQDIAVHTTKPLPPQPATATMTRCDALAQAPDRHYPASPEAGGAPHRVAARPTPGLAQAEVETSAFLFAGAVPDNPALPSPVPQEVHQPSDGRSTHSTPHHHLRHHAA